MLKNIYEQYKQDVFNYLMSLTNNAFLSEDLVSETFLSAIKSIHTFKGKSTIKTWLFSIARNKWYEHMRKEKKNISLDDLSYNYLTIESNLEESVIKGELFNEIKCLLEKEEDRTKDIVMMRIEGYSYIEISKKHNIYESSARVIDYRAKKKIRENLKERGVYYE